MKHTTRSLVLLLIFLFTALASFSPAAAGSAVHEKIRVGYSSSGSLLYQDENGVFRGYDVIYLYEIARYTGWDYEFVPYDDWSKAVADVHAGKIDILPTVLKTPQREPDMLFSLYPMASTNIALIARPGDGRYVYGDLSSTAGARVGVRANTADTKAFEQWAWNHGLTFDVTDYPDRGDLLAALRAGTIDLAATSYAGEAQKFPAIAEFSPQSMYFAVNPAKPQIAAQLNQAMGDILLYDSSFTRTLERMTKPDRNRYHVLVSDKERSLIDALPTQRVALPMNEVPFSYERDGKIRGITVHVLNRIAELTGLSFAYVPAKDAEDACRLVENGDADMVGGFVARHIEAQAAGLRMTTPYYQDQMAFLVRNGQDPDHVAIPSDYLAVMQEIFPDLQYEVTSSTAEALDLLEKGRVDALACDMASISYYSSVLHRGDYEMRPVPNVPAHITFALPRDADPALGFLLDRTIQYLVDTEMDEITQEAINRAPLSFTNLFDRLSGTQANILVFALVLAICFLAYSLWLVWHRRGLERRITAIEHARENMTASLAWEKKMGHAQQDFIYYMDDNIVEPLQTSLRSLLKKGAAEPGTPLHEDYLRCGQIYDFMMEVRLLNQLAQDKFTLRQWRNTALRQMLLHHGNLLAKAAECKRIHYAQDFSGVSEEQALLDARGFSMMLMRIMNYLMNLTPEGGSLLLSASVSHMVEATPPRNILWLFVHAPDVLLPPHILQAMLAMQESAQKSPRTIYESMAKIPCHTAEERALLIRAAILDLLIPKLGGEWEIHCTEKGGTEIAVSLLLEKKNA